MVVTYALFGCKQSELLYSYPNYPKTKIEVDLSATDYTFEDDLLSYSVIFYPIDDGIIPLDKLEPKAFRMQRESDFEISIAPGDYNVVMYSDYSGQNAFYSKDSYDEIYCEAQSQASSTANNGKGDGDLFFAAEPDPMVVANMDKVTIDNSGQGMGLSGQVVTFPARQVTTRFNARVWMTNPRSIKTYDGHVGYVDSRYYISQDQTNLGGYVIAYTPDNSGIVTLSNDNSNGDAVGYLNIQIELFGFTQESSTKYTDAEAASMTRVQNNVAAGDAYLHIHLTYPGVSDAPTDFKFDIADKINELEKGEEGSVTIEIGTADSPEMNLPKMINDGDDESDGGFDVGVGDWDDENDYVLDFTNGTVR